jgi:hypothetical protein
MVDGAVEKRLDSLCVYRDNNCVHPVIKGSVNSLRQLSEISCLCWRHMVTINFNPAIYFLMQVECNGLVTASAKSKVGKKECYHSNSLYLLCSRNHRGTMTSQHRPLWIMDDLLSPKNSTHLITALIFVCMKKPVPNSWFSFLFPQKNVYFPV